jgi:hypothetical protein
MFMLNVFRSRILAAGLIGAVLLLIMPVAEFAQAQAPALASNGSLVGFVYAKDMKTPVGKAVVKLRDVLTPKEYASLPTDANGMYKITGIKEGRYILGVTTAEGDFNFDYVMYLKGGDMAKLSVALSPGGKMSGADAESRSFFKGDAWFGVLMVVVAGGLVLYGVLHKDQVGEVSPIR